MLTENRTEGNGPLALPSRSVAILVELLVYILLGVLWALPFRFVFRGVGQEDPDADGGPET